MRSLLLLSVLWLGWSAFARADDEQLVERFDGHNSLTTSDFKVPDGWEIRWHSNQTLSIGVILLDGTVVAGSTGMNTGSLYFPKGGTFRLRVKGEEPIPWDVAVTVIGTKAPPESDDLTPFYVPTPGPVDAAGTNAPDTDVSTNAAPATATNAPDAAETNATPEAAAPPAAPPAPTEMTPAQTAAIVQIKGDRAQGAGFLVQAASGPTVITNLHLLADNPHLAITTTAGADVQILTLQGAADRDVAMIGIQNNGYTFLDTVTDIPGSVLPGDAVLTQVKYKDSGDPATVLTIRTDRIDIEHLRSHDNSGGPVLQAKSGKAIAVVTPIPKPIVTTDLDQTPFATRDAQANNPSSYAALRFDAVANWETYDWKRFATETAFLDQFHQRSRCLDSYLNNSRTNDFRPTAKLYLSDDKIKSANDTYAQDAAGGDSAQRADSLRALLFELGIVVGADMDQIQQPSNFYTFDQARARDEIAYRNALKAQLDFYSNNLTLFGAVARRNN